MTAIRGYVVVSETAPVVRQEPRATETSPPAGARTAAALRGVLVALFATAACAAHALFIAAAVFDSGALA